MKYKILLYLGYLLKPILTRLIPTKWKEFNELLYWKSQNFNEGVLKMITTNIFIRHILGLISLSMIER
jgi:hypothetical protein